jgi:hypothetical protein
MPPRTLGNDASTRMIPVRKKRRPRGEPRVTLRGARAPPEGEACQPPDLPDGATRCDATLGSGSHHVVLLETPAGVATNRNASLDRVVRTTCRVELTSLRRAPNTPEGVPFARLRDLCLLRQADIDGRPPISRHTANGRAKRRSKESAAAEASSAVLPPPTYLTRHHAPSRRREVRQPTAIPSTSLIVGASPDASTEQRYHARPTL